MEKYRYSDEARKALESMKQALAVYQVIDGRVVTLLVSDGFRKLFGHPNREQAVFFMDHDMYKDIHPDDRMRLTEASLRFAESNDDEEIEVIYRTRGGMDSFARRIGNNPVTGNIAIAVAVLSISDSVDTEDQRKQQARIEETRRERDALARVMAFAEDYFVLYSVDPETGRYVEFTASPSYDALGFAKEGEDFFLRGIEDGKRTVYAGDPPGIRRASAVPRAAKS